jgi:GNAT superfamily N-acetyltransferase
MRADVFRLKAPDGYPTPTKTYFETFLSRPEFFYEIAVAQAHQRRGIGRRLISMLKLVCREGNVMKMWVPTGRSNIAATRLYASTGAAPLPNGDEVTYAYPPASFAEPAE